VRYEYYLAKVNAEIPTKEYSSIRHTMLPFLSICKRNRYFYINIHSYVVTDYQMLAFVQCTQL